jgi:fumarylacetoacetase
LLNDWSARDIQRWEYQPLGPFLAKNFATTISPWVITLDALEPYRRPGPSRAADDPVPLPYLQGRPDGGFALVLEVWIQRAGEALPKRVSRASFLDMYWTLEQMIAHHASNGCNLRPGDLIGSGTVSGPGEDERGCLLELRQPFLADGDTVILRGWAEAEGRPRLSLGECSGNISRD